MANKKVKSDYLALKKFNQKTEKGDIFERDIMTINPLEDLFTPGQDVIYSDSNFKFSVRTDQDRTKKHTKDGWLKTSEGKEVWHLSDVDSSPISEESEVVIKPDYSSMKDFAYYGSAVEMLRAAVNHVIMYFPAELYFSEQTLNDYLGLVGSDKIPTYGTYKVIPNDFNINVEIDTIEESDLDNPYRYLCLHAINYDVYKNGVFQSSGITRNDFQKDPDYSCGDGVLGTVTLTNTSSFTITVYVYDGKNYLIYDNSNYTGYSVRPNSVIVNEYFATIDEFEKILLNKETKPLYKAVFETPYETDEGNKYVMESYIWPSRNDWNPIIDGGGYEMYIGSLIKLATFHDEYDSNIIWRMLTHEAIKNLDWTFFRENGSDAEDLSKIDSSKIEAFLQLYGRQFDGLKRYIDSIKYTNNVTYNQKNNLPDYMLTDVVENSGFEAILPNATAKTDVVSDPLYSARTIGYSEVDANTQFMRNLKINAPYINSLKGTRYGVETMLKLLGLKYDENLEKSEFKITEYVTVASGSSEQCPFSDDLSYGDNFYPRPVCSGETNGDTCVKYPSVKDVISININKGDGTVDDMETYFDGIPVKPFRCVNKDLWCGDTPTFYAIPWYENGKHYDGGWYFQSKGGWGKTPKEKIDNPVVPSGVTELRYNRIYDESETSLKYADNVKEMKGFFKSEIKDGTVCYVTDLESWDEYSADVTSHYFIYNENEESGDTWNNISVEEIRNAEIPNGAKVVYLENIKESTEGNNPHISNDEYDDGQEYLEYMNKIFKYTLDTSGFTRFSKNDIDKIDSAYTFGISSELSDLTENDIKCDYFYNPQIESCSGCLKEQKISINGDGIETVTESEMEKISVNEKYVNPEGGARNEEPAANSVINVKNFHLEIKKEISTTVPEANQKWQDYITNVVINYVKQMLPSTAIFSWEFTGGTEEPYFNWTDGSTAKTSNDVSYNGDTLGSGYDSNYDNLSFTSNQSWCRVTNTSNNVTATITANSDTANTRTATITVKNGSTTVGKWTITQQKKSEAKYFNWSNGSTAITTDNVSYNGETKTTGYTSNYESLSFTSNQSWCTVSHTLTGVTATITANSDTANTRTAIITVTNGSTVVGKWTIVQQKKPEAKYFNWSNGSTAITTTDVSYNGATLISGYSSNYESLSFTSNQSWCTVTTASTNATATIQASTNTASTRTAVVTVKNGSTTVGTWSITQQKKPEDKYLWVVSQGQTTATVSNVSNAGGSQELVILTNYSQSELDGFSVNKPDWITNVKLTKSTNKLTFNVSSNPVGGNSRSGSITVGGLTIDVSQVAGEAFKVNLKVNNSTSPSNIGSAVTSFSISTTPNSDSLSYTIKVDNTQVTATTGSYPATNYTCGENTATTAVTYTVRVYSGSTVLETVTIKQNPKYVAQTRTIQFYGGGMEWKCQMYNQSVLAGQDIGFYIEMYRTTSTGYISGNVYGDKQQQYVFDMNGTIEFETTEMGAFYADIKLTIDSSGPRCFIWPTAGNSYGFSSYEIGGGGGGQENTGTVYIPAGSAGSTTSVQLDMMTWQTSDD